MEVDRVTECPVCYTELDRPLQLNCGHTVCANCVDRMVTHERNGAAGMVGGFDDNVQQQMRRLMMVMEDAPGPIRGRPMAFPVPERERRIQQEPNPPVPDGQGLGGAYAQPPPQPQPAPQPHNMPQPPPHMQHMGMQGMFYGGPQPGHPPQFMGQMEPVRVYNGFPWQRPNGRPERYMRRPGGIAGTRIRCPECRSETVVPAGGLPINYKLKELIERLRSERNGDAEARYVTGGHQVPTCSECDKEVAKEGVYFVCGACPDKIRICSLCIVRSHMKHSDQITERRALTERELNGYLEQVDQEAAASHEISIGIANIIQRLPDCGAQLKMAMEEDLKHFTKLSVRLRSIDRNSTHEEANTYIATAHEYANGFRQLESAVTRLRSSLKKNFEELLASFRSDINKVAETADAMFFRNLDPSDICQCDCEIKEEPQDVDEEQEVVILAESSGIEHARRNAPVERSPTPFHALGEPIEMEAAVAGNEYGEDRPPPPIFMNEPQLILDRPARVNNIDLLLAAAAVDANADPVDLRTPGNVMEGNGDIVQDGTTALQARSTVLQETLDGLASRARHIAIVPDGTEMQQNTPPLSPSGSPPRRRRRHDQPTISEEMSSNRLRVATRHIRPRPRVPPARESRRRGGDDADQPGPSHML